MKFITNVTSFKAGVLSKKLFGRTDIREYQEGLSEGKNALIAKTGGAYKRFGLQTVFQLAEDQEAQIETVRLNAGKSVYIVFYTYPSYTPNFSKWRIHDANGNPLSAAFDTAGDVGGFQVVKFNEWLIITHKDGVQPVYVRLGVNGSNKVVMEEIKLFDTLSPFSFPQSEANPDVNKKVRLKNVSAATGATQIESQGFNLNDVFKVGDWVMVTGLSYINSSPKLATGMYRITGNLGATTADVVSFFYYQTTTGTPFDVMADLDALLIGSVHTITPSFGKTPPIDSQWFDEWSYSLWSGARSYPKHVAVDEGRLVFSNTDEKPTTIWGSKTNDPFFFLDKRFLAVDVAYIYEGNSGTAAVTQTFYPPYSGDILETDPYQFTLSSKNSSEVTIMESAKTFLAGTDKQEFLITGNSGALSQKNFSSRPHTSHGSYSNLSAVFDNVVLFVGRNRKSLYLFKYSEENGSFISKELTILNGDPFEKDTIKALDWHEELGVLFIVTDAGKLITLTINEETQTAGFTTHEIDGLVQDCTYIIEENGTEYVALAIARENGVYIDKITAAELGPVSVEMLEQVDRLSYLDNFRIMTNSDVYDSGAEDSITIFDAINDYVAYNYSMIKIGDTVEFSCTNASVLSGTGLALGTPYFVIPFKDAFGNIGMRLATSLANAQSNTYIDITAPLTASDDLIFPTFVRDVQVIPTEQFSSGDEVTVLARTTGGLIEQFTFTADGNATYDLGIAYNEVAYGQTYEFHIATMPVEAGQQWGSAQLGIKRVDRANVRVYNTRSFKISSDGYNSEEVDFGEVFTGARQIAVIGNPEFEHIIHIQNDKAEGCFIASLALRGVNNDG